MKKGFTLIEVLAVIVILGIIMLIAYPAIDNVIKDSREKALQENINRIEEVAITYSVTADLGYSEEYKTLDLQVLKNAGLLKDEDIKNPVTDKDMTGCVVYKWVPATNQYDMKYSETCEIPK